MQYKFIPIMKILLPLLFSGLATINGFSQAQVIELKSYTERGLRTGFFIEKIIDARLDTTQIGFVVKDGEFRSAVFEKNLVATLGEAFAELIYPKKEVKDTLLFVVRDFSVSELKNAAGEFGWFNGLFDCYLKRNGDYHLLVTKDLYEEGNQSNMTLYQDDMILFELAKMVKQLNEALAAAPDFRQESAISLEELTSRLVAPPVPFVQHKVKGVYRSFSEFRRNDPGIKDVEIRLPAKKTNNYRAKDIQIKQSGGSEIDLKKRNSTWGFCDGENVYLNCRPVNASNEYARLIHRGEWLPFFSEVTVEPLPTSAAVYGGIAGGLAGAVIGHAIDAAKDGPEKTGLLVMNYETGRIRDLTVAFMSEIIRDDEELAREYESSATKTSPETKLDYLDRYYQRKKH